MAGRNLGMLVALGAFATCGALPACGGEAPPPATATAATPGTPAIQEVPRHDAASLPPSNAPDIDLRAPSAAVVHGQPVAFDGLAEGLAWPALEKAIGARAPGQTLSLQVARGEPTIDVLRAAWTLRTSDLRVQTQDAGGELRVVELRAKRDGAPPVAGCHLAVFVRLDGSLRVAAPGGPRAIDPDHAADTLARSLELERARCPIKYLAVGSESDQAPWGRVFDVLATVDRAKSAGDTRYVLGQAMH
jgi:hypothetical protein